MSALLGEMDRAWERCYRLVADGDQVHVSDERGILEVWSPCRAPFFNVVLQSRLPPEAMEARVSELQGAHRARGTPIYWRVGPSSAHPGALTERLAALGFQPAPVSVAVVCALPAATRPLGLALRHELVRSLDDYRGWFSVFASGFGVDASLEPLFFGLARRVGFIEEYVNHVLYDGRTPVACATTLLSAGSPMAGLFNFTVAPGARGSGAAWRLLDAVLAHAGRRGFDRVGQFATPEAAPFYAKAGAVEVGIYRNWIWWPDQVAS